MTENITQMRERHDREIVELQASCPHDREKEWMPYSYSGGDHLNGDICLVCLICGKELDRKKLPDDWQDSKVWADENNVFHWDRKLDKYLKQENEAIGVIDGC